MFILEAVFVECERERGLIEHSTLTRSIYDSLVKEMIAAEEIYLSLSADVVKSSHCLFLTDMISFMVHTVYFTLHE